MTNVIDQAQQFDAINLRQGLHVQQLRAAATVHPAPKGECLNWDCCRPFDNPARLFCDPLCEREYQRQASAGR